MAIRRGAKDLGLNTTWRFEFMGHGAVLTPRADTIAIDIGNKFCHGVIDQHQDGSLGPSTSMLIFNHPEFVYDHLLGPWLNRADEGISTNGRDWSPVILTHKQPDFDGIASALLIQELVEHGELPGWAKSLAQFSAQVDQGLWQLAPESGDVEVRLRSIATVFYGLDDEHLTDDERVAFGVEWLRTEATHLSNMSDREVAEESWYGPDAGAWREISERTRRVWQKIESDLALYTQERKEGNITECEVELPTTDEDRHEVVIVKGFIVEGMPRSRMLKYWTRGSGFPFLLCPAKLSTSAPPSKATDQQPRVVISLDPTYRDQDTGLRPTLKGLGQCLESMECQHRITKRHGRPRFDWATNDDPWYDGKGHDFGIVDAPRSGTVLGYQQIIDTVLERFWEPKVDLEVRILRAFSSEKPQVAYEPIHRNSSLSKDTSSFFNDIRSTKPQPSSSRFWSDLSLSPKLHHTQTRTLCWPNFPNFCLEESHWIYQGTDGELITSMRDIKRHDASTFIAIRQRPSAVNAQSTSTAMKIFCVGSKELQQLSITENLYASGREVFMLNASDDMAWNEVTQIQLMASHLHSLLSHILERATLHTGFPNPSESNRIVQWIDDALARYHIQEFSMEPSLQKLALSIRQHLALDGLIDRARHEADALNNHIAHLASRKTEFLLFILGLLGFMEFINGIESFVKLEPLYWVFGGSSLVIILSLGLFIYKPWSFRRTSRSE